MPDQAEALREFVARDGWQGAPPTVDKTKLWDDLKSELARQAEGRSWEFGSSPVDTMGKKRARAMLDRMEQAETFARVRADLEVRHD